jgi:thiaminase/transcriptional activator TenA
MTATFFADDLKQHSNKTWDKILHNRFIVDLSNDSLPKNKFLFYLKQDHYFLEQFSKFLHSAKLKTKENKMKSWLDSLSFSTVHLEMKMQEQLLDLLGDLAPSTVSSSSSNECDPMIMPSKTTLDYTAYLTNLSSNGSFGEIVSAMAPCPWTYLEIAQKLSKTPIRDEIYGKWVQFYSSHESYKQVEEIQQILNILGKAEGEKSKEAMKNHFATACEYEYLFWEMAYNLNLEMK